MVGQIAVQSAVAAEASLTRRQPLLITSENTRDGSNRSDKAGGGGDGSRRGSRMGEMAGECAAVCCCCPCSMMHLLVLVYRVPTGLCKKAWREKKRKRLLKKKRKIYSLEERENQRKSSTRSQSHMNMFGFDSDYDDESISDYEDYRNSKQNDVVDLDEQMWDRFYEAGFWRSASQRAEI